MPGMSLSRPFNALWKGYERSLHRRPILTQCTTSALLWGCGDVLAQRVGEQKQMHELDMRRVAITAGFGAAFMGPIGHHWYAWLDQTAGRLFAAGSPSFIAFKLIADSALFGPAYLVAFYAWGCALIDGSGWEGFSKKIKKDFVPTMAAELAVWPIIQFANFTRVPVEHQLLTVNIATLLDATFLSWARSQEDWVGTMMSAIEEMKRHNAASAAEASMPAAVVAVAPAAVTASVGTRTRTA